MFLKKISFMYCSTSCYFILFRSIREDVLEKEEELEKVKRN